MDTSPPINEEEVFQVAAALPIGERAAYLDAACEGHSEMRVRLRRMLSVEGKREFMQAETQDVSAEAEAEMARLKPEEAGERIGRYKLREQIGQGGFGTVWVADQEEPVKRRVALKIIKMGMDTKEVIARFEQERQALALMDHPNIAKVLDAGATQHGRPFFVMELVRGITITDYCDQANLTTEERLDLFINVCHAVQHAHQKGIIHRDLKPSNILVTMHDGVPVPKVIDFGVAKATQAQFTDLTIYTQYQQMIGTPLYMSPEQAEMSGIDIDTRSDIYSLGVLLYELLTGRTPVDADTLLRLGLDEIRRIIREQEAPRPSTVLRTMSPAAQTDIAHHRHIELPKLIGLLRGDLDWIVMKALEKDRTRRYDTANGLAMDIRRHLAHEPVLARPPSQMYRFRRFVRRNKLAVIAGSAVVVAVAIGLVLSTVLFFREKEARRQAMSALASLQETAPTFEAQARALLDEGKIDSALKKIEFAIGLAPKNSDYRLFRANLLEACQRLDEATVDYRAVLALRPGDAAAKENLVLCERLIAASRGQPLTPDLQKDLLRSLVAQKRLIEAAPLSARFSGEFAATDAVIRARLKEYMSQRGWEDTRLVRDERGDYSLDLSNLVIGDLAKLAGLPITSLKLVQSTLTDVSGVRQLPLTHLDLSKTAVSDLAPLAGMKLTSLTLDQLRVTNLGPLAGMPLELLRLNGTPVSDLGPLKGMPLRDLKITSTLCTDLSPLVGMPLATLVMSSTKCKDLTPLAGLPLRNFYFDNTPVEDIGPLRGLPLELICIASGVTDLAPLSGSPLRTFHAHICDNLRTLKPLLDCPNLETVILPQKAPDVIVLRAHPNLKSIDLQAKTGGTNATEGPFTVEDFWNRYGPFYQRRAELMEVVTQLRKLPAERGWNKRPEEIVEINDDNTLNVSVHHTDLADLSLFRGLPLKRLDIGDTRITDLGDLHGASLQFLSISGAPVADLNPLRGLPLKQIGLEACVNVKDISPLADCLELVAVLFPRAATGVEALRNLPKLRRIGWRYTPTNADFEFASPAAEFWKQYDEIQPVLKAFRAENVVIDPEKIRFSPGGTFNVDLEGSLIQSLSCLRGLPIKELKLRGVSRISDLSPLAGMTSLEILDLYATTVTDLAALHGLPLRRLEIGGLKIADLEPLRGLPLEILTIDHCDLIKDISLLAEIPTLRSLLIPKNVTGIEALRKLPKLEYLGAKYNGNFDQLAPPAAEFWKHYDEIRPVADALNKDKVRFNPEKIRKEADGRFIVDLRGSSIKSLEPLRGLPIKELHVTDSAKISDLSPLAGITTLEWLDVTNTAVADISPLSGLRLRRLELGGSKIRVRNLEPLRGQPLQVLTIDRFDESIDVSPLGEIPTLTNLLLSKNATGIEALRKLPKLEFLGTEWTGNGDQPAPPKKAFWDEWDKTHKPAQ